MLLTLAAADAVQARTEFARPSRGAVGAPTLIGDRVAWGAVARDRGLDVFAGGERQPTRLIAHEPPLPITPEDEDRFAFAASASHLAVLHAHRHDTDPRYGRRVTLATELRAGRPGGPLSIVLRCEDQQSPSFDLQGQTLAYGPAECASDSPISIVLRDVESGEVVLRLAQSPETTDVTDLRLAGRYVGFVRHLGSVREVVVADRSDGSEVLMLREKRDFVGFPVGFALQADGKVAIALNRDGARPELAWASPDDPTPNPLPVTPFSLDFYVDLAMARDRIAFVYNAYDACGSDSSDTYGVGLTDLSGQMAHVGPPGYRGRIGSRGFDGRLIAWRRFAEGPVMLQDLEREPAHLRRPPPCRRYAKPAARLFAPRRGIVDSRGRLRLRASCLDRAGPEERPDACHRWVLLRPPGKSACQRFKGELPFDQAPSRRWLLSDAVSLFRDSGESVSVNVRLLPQALARLKRRRTLRAVAEWCEYGFAPIVSRPLTLRLGRPARSMR